jgi:hypothetical protein
MTHGRSLLFAALLALAGLALCGPRKTGADGEAPARPAPGSRPAVATSETPSPEHARSGGAPQEPRPTRETRVP